MATNLAKLLELRTELDGFLSGYEQRKHLFDQVPKYDIDLVFSLWDEYLAFLDENADAEKAERVRRAEKRVKEGQEYEETPAVHLDGGFPEKIREPIKHIYKAMNDTLNLVFPSTNIPELAENALGDPKLWKFFVHDINHLDSDLNRQQWTVSQVYFDESVARMRHRREEMRWFLELFNNNSEFMYGAKIEPYKMLDFIVADELGERQKMAFFKPADLALKTALTLQNRHPQFEFALVNELTDSLQNEIAVDAEPVAMYGNSGLAFSILYNLAKN